MKRNKTFNAVDINVIFNCEDCRQFYDLSSRLRGEVTELIKLKQKFFFSTKTFNKKCLENIKVIAATENQGFPLLLRNQLHLSDCKN